MAACPSLNGFTIQLTVFTSRRYDPDDDDSLEEAKRSARTWVENQVQRQVQAMRAEQRQWEDDQTCDAPCTGTITEHEEPDGPIQVRFRVGRRSVRALAEMHLASTWSCDEPELADGPQQTARSGDC